MKLFLSVMRIGYSNLEEIFCNIHVMSIACYTLCEYVFKFAAFTFYEGVSVCGCQYLANKCNHILKV